MCALNLGIVDYLNCYPLLLYLEKEKNLFTNIIKDVPAVLNKKFLEGSLDITPISSIEYARNAEDCMILPNVSIAADGKVLSILLVSKYKVDELADKTIALTSSSATSVVLLKILLKFYFKIKTNFITMSPVLSEMLQNADAALLIGDDALREGLSFKDGYVYDLGQCWKDFTGYPMVYALWVMKEKFAISYSNEVQATAVSMQNAKKWATCHKEEILLEAKKVYNFSPALLETYFETIRYEFNTYYQEAVMTFYDYANKIGQLKEVPRLKIWGK